MARRGKLARGVEGELLNGESALGSNRRHGGGGRTPRHGTGVGGLPADASGRYRTPADAKNAPMDTLSKHTFQTVNLKG